MDQKHLRQRLLLFAYAYEFEHDTLVSDAEFDRLCGLVDVSIPTDRPDLDVWFKDNFNACTGMWINNYPEEEMHKIAKIYNRIKEHNIKGAKQ